MAAIKHFAQINGTSALKDDVTSHTQSVVSAPSLHVSHSRNSQRTSALGIGRTMRSACVNGLMRTDVVQDLRYGTARGLMPRNVTPTWKVVSACTVYGVIAVLAIVIGI